MAQDTPYQENNILAKILRGELPTIKFYEDSQAIGIMDIMPQTKGHCLIIPKAKARNLLDISPDALQALMPLIQKVARACMAAFSADGISLMQYNESAGGQTIFHLHFHILPRFKDEPLKVHGVATAETEILEAQAQLLRAQLQQ